MLGGNDMNVFGSATKGKTLRRRPSPRLSSPDTDRPSSRKSRWPTREALPAILDGLEYRGTMFLQCFTTCQPEQTGVADDMALFQAQRVRDSRGVPEFVFNPRLGETYQEALDVIRQSQQGTRLVRDQAQVNRRNHALHRGSLVHDRSTLPQTTSKKIKPEVDQLLRRLRLDLLEVVAEAGFGGAPVSHGVARVSPVDLCLVSYQSRSLLGLPLMSSASC